MIFEQSLVSESSMRDYFRNHKLMLKIFGLSLTGGEGTAYKIYSFFILFPFNIMYSVLDFWELFKHDSTVVENFVGYVFAYFMTLAKTFVLFQNKKVIVKMINKLEGEPFVVNLSRGGYQEEKLINECVWITGMQTRVYWITTFITALTTASYSIATRLIYSDYNKWELSYGPFTILNVTHSPNFEITWFYQNFSVLSLSMHFTTADLLQASMLAHISYQFKILRNYIGRIETQYITGMQETNVNYPSPHSNTYNSSTTWKYLHAPLREAVEYHLAILSLAEEMENVFSTLLLSIFLGTLGMLCFLIFHISTLEDPIHTVKTAGEILVTCIQVATVCYWGEQVIFESQEVGRAAYEVNFVGTDVRYQKGLAMIIRRSQKATKISAGKFADICLYTFSWVLRTAYSSFMVLKSANSNKT